MNKIYDVKIFKNKIMANIYLAAYSFTSKGKNAYADFVQKSNEHYPIRDYKDVDFPRKKLFREYMYFKFKYGVSLVDYFLYEFYRASEYEVSMYISDRRRIELHNLANSVNYRHVFGNKKDFYSVYSEYMQKSCLFADKLTDLETFRSFVYGKGYVIVKPCDGQRGIGVMKKSVQTEEEIQAVWKECTENALLVEQVINSCDELALFHPESLNTIRVSTVLDKDGQVHIMAATLRTGVGDNVVDNGHSGGVYASIDVSTGMLDSIGYDALGRRYPVHPDTRHSFAGFIVPEWEKLCRLTVEVAKITPQMRYIGWDWALNEKHEWILIEGNEPGGIDVHQHPTLTGRYEAYRNAICGGNQ